MSDEKVLGELIAKLQRCIRDERLTKRKVCDAISDLKGLGYKYGYDSFPRLKNTKAFKAPKNVSPGTLAEALLWKMGKWKAYKQFAAAYKDKDSGRTKTNVVFYAFARHLADSSNPIFDQHALRAVWALCKLSPKEGTAIKRFLMKDQGIWKSSGAGKSAAACYTLFVRLIKSLVNEHITMKHLDLLLMPLGQAIKKLARNYDELHSLCGW